VCVLLVEDELLIRSIMAESLVDAGYAVLHAGTADEAMALVETTEIPISVLVTDIHLPGGKTGLDVVRVMRAKHPTLPVIVATGRPDVVGPDWYRSGRVSLLHKPYGPSELVERVKKALSDA
jgi:DNA-binding response OmpR family regulator